MKLSPKKINRFVVATLMLAPLVYLFGSLFAGLKGANGTQVYADEPNYFSVVYSEQDLLKGTGGSTSSFGTTSSDARSSLFILEGYSSFSFDLLTPATTSGSNFARLWKYNDDFSYNGFDTFSASDGTLWHWSYHGPLSHFYIGFYNTNPATSGHLEDITFRITYYLDNVPEINTDGYQLSQYVFGQFFTKDNFVNKMGENALSDSPWGFVPASQLIKYVDDNMLHFKNNSNEGVFFYGYMYWAFHVILLDLGFYICTFVPRLFHKVVSKLEGDE